MFDLSCLCGKVCVRPQRRPEYIHECNCALCRKSGARWAYFHPDQVTVEGDTRGFTRTDKDEPAAELRFCEQCGSTTHFVLTAAAAEKFGNTLMGVNMALATENELAGIELRFPDGAAWSGAGEFVYLREARVLGA